LVEFKVTAINSGLTDSEISPLIRRQTDQSPACAKISFRHAAFSINIKCMQESAEVVKETYKPGDFIFFEGDIDYHFYIVQTGEVQIFTKNKSGGRVNIATISDGESFGEFALLEKQPRSASAQAITECVLIKVSEAGYEQLLSELPVWASSMLESFAKRMKSMNEKLKDMPQFLSKDS
jgi:CRP/FNR family cyclic AMP-dependent transcriptional regulator